MAGDLDVRIDLTETAPQENASSEARSLPAANTPWGRLRTLLTPHVTHGDVAAAERLYTDHRRCLNYWEHKRVSALIDRSLAAGIEDPGQRQAALEKKQMWDGLLADGAALCNQTRREEIDADNYSVLRNAARAGSERAKECYVFSAMAGFESPASPQLLAEYRELANGYMQEGIAHGSWLMADNMIVIHGGSQRGLGHDWSTMIWPYDLRTAFVYAAVLDMGASQAENAKDMQFYAAILKNIDQQLQWPRQDAQAALNEANLLFHRSFADVPYVPVDDRHWCRLQ